jgi:hypothetical protein
MPTGCEILFEREQAQAMQDLIEGATGKPCPCKNGVACPLLPKTGVVLPLPQIRAVA